MLYAGSMGTVVCLPENLAKICGESGQWLVVGGRSGPASRQAPGRGVEDLVERKQPRCTMVVFDRNGAETTLAAEDSLGPFFGRTLLPAVAPASTVVGCTLGGSENGKCFWNITRENCHRSESAGVSRPNIFILSAFLLSGNRFINSSGD